MTAWLKQRWGWIALVLLAAIYYPFFGKGFEGITVYSAAADCVWRGEVMLPCAPPFSYEPALAALALPFVFIPAALHKVVWYAICVASLVVTVRFAEAMGERLYPGVTRGENLVWLRSASLLLCGKQILEVLNYQAYEAPALAMLTVGMWALTVGRESAGGFWLGVGAAVRATPVIYLPYLLLKRRYLAALAFLAAFFALSLLPDLISALRGGHVGYLYDWLRQVAGPGILPGSPADLHFLSAWASPTSLGNQSLRGLVNRFATEPVLGLSPRLILFAVYGAFGFVLAALLLISPRDKAYAAIDGAILLIAMLALSPMTSRYHFVLVLPAVVLVVAAVIGDRRMRLFGGVVLAASFMLLTGTSNDLTGQRVAEFAYRYGFMTEGAIVLLVAFAAMLRIWPPPGIAANAVALPAREAAQYR